MTYVYDMWAGVNSRGGAMTVLVGEILLAFGKDGKMLVTIYYVMFFYEVYWNISVLRLDHDIPTSLS